MIMKLIKDKKTDSNFLFTFFEMRLMQSLSTKKQICQKVSSDCSLRILFLFLGEKILFYLCRHDREVGMTKIEYDISKVQT